MPRQGITFNSPNDQWLRSRVESEEYANKSEVVNELIRKARQCEDETEECHDAVGVEDPSRTPDIERFIATHLPM